MHNQCFNELYELLNAKYPTYTFTVNSIYYSRKEVDHYSIEILGSLRGEPDNKVLLIEPSLCKRLKS